VRQALPRWWKKLFKHCQLPFSHGSVVDFGADLMGLSAA
jgi:hypothetical protein